MLRILGIDPGSRITGYGIIETDGRNSCRVTSGCIKTPDGELPQRLAVIFDAISNIVTEFQPQSTAIENVFMAKNAASALKLGQARGAAICAMATRGLDVAEYSPRGIKQAVVGNGGADKDQVQHMVKLLLNYKQLMKADESDALAVALCHAHTMQFARRLGNRKR